MNHKSANVNLLRTVSVGYVIAVLLYQVLYLLIPFQYAISKSVLQYISPALAIAGFGLLALNLFVSRPFLELRNCWMQIGMLVCLTFSALLNFRYGLVNNVKSLIWQSVQMLLLFTVISSTSEVDWKRIMKKIFVAVAVLLTVANLISFYQYFNAISCIMNVNSYEIRQGLMEGRLFGIYNNPYDTGVISMVMMMSAIYYLTRTKKIWARIGCGLVALECFVMAALCNSRSTVVALAATTFVLAICVVMHRSTMKKVSSRVVRVVAAIVAAVLALSFVFGAFSLTHRICKSFAADPKTDISQSETDDKPFDADFELEEVYDREDVGKQNISNNRFDIWSDYFEVMRRDPLVAIFGASSGGYMRYIFANHPDLYIVSHMVKCYPNMIAHARIYDTHNGYVSAMISGGLVTMVLLIIFLVNMTVKGLKCVNRPEKMSAEVLLELCVLCFLLVDAFFATDLFFKCTISSVTFWMSYAFLMRRIRAGEHTAD